MTDEEFEREVENLVEMLNSLRRIERSKTMAQS